MTKINIMDEWKDATFVRCDKSDTIRAAISGKVKNTKIEVRYCVSNRIYYEMEYDNKVYGEQYVEKSLGYTIREIYQRQREYMDYDKSILKDIFIHKTI